MTLATLHRGVALGPSPGRLSPGQARQNVREAADRLQAALAAQWKADDDEGARKAKDAMTDERAAAIMRKSELRKAEHEADVFRAWAGALVSTLRGIAADANSPEAGQARIAGRLEDLAHEIKRLSRL
jgi:hypothetical protein